MKPLLEYLKKLLDANDPTSMMRFLSLITVIAILYMWVVFSIFKRALVDIPSGVVAFAGLVVGGKAVQSFAELKNKLQEKREDKP
jgi:hypothetical protein